MGIKCFSTVSDLQDHLAQTRSGRLVGFVPTMGALHEGHLSLIDRALSECDLVVVSIFVNPKQFNNAQDLKNYPRTIDQDIALIGGREVLLFAPDFAEVYPDGSVDVNIDIGALGTVMEGKFRPGHFDGVITVVSRLFDIVNPDRAYFGEKDFQQLAVIRYMTKQQNRTVEIIPCEVKREPSGLAMSSRNMLLTAEERHRSKGIFAIISKAIEHKNSTTPEELKRILTSNFKQEGFDLEYLEIVDPFTLQSLKDVWVKNARLCVAVYLGKVRLIDNIEIP